MKINLHYFFTKCKIFDRFTFIFLKFWTKIEQILIYEISIVPECS